MVEHWVQRGHVVRVVVLVVLGIVVERRYNRRGMFVASFGRYRLVLGWVRVRDIVDS